MQIKPFFSLPLKDPFFDEEDVNTDSNRCFSPKINHLSPDQLFPIEMSQALDKCFMSKSYIF